MLVLPNLIYSFTAILIKILANNFVGIKRLILKFIWKVKDHSSQHNIESREKILEDKYTKLQGLLSGYNNQEGLVLVKVKSNRSMKQIRKS
jgi:hypothetical protein